MELNVNDTFCFNNISVILWWSVLLIEETRAPRENHQPAASHWHTSVVYGHGQNIICGGSMRWIYRKWRHRKSRNDRRGRPREHPPTSKGSPTADDVTSSEKVPLEPILRNFWLRMHTLKGTSASLTYITNLVCYTYFHLFFSPECQHIFGKQTGYIFQSPKTIKTWTTKHYASLNQWYNTE
jgi:hypothetical protein